MQEHHLPTGERYVINRFVEEAGGWIAYITWLADGPLGTAAAECQVPGLHETQEVAVAVAHEFAPIQVLGDPELRAINYRFGVR